VQCVFGVRNCSPDVDAIINSLPAGRGKLQPWIWLFAALIWPTSNGLGEVESLPLLTNVLQVRQLSRAEADRGYPVCLEGVLTLVDTSRGSVFLQDGTGGIYLLNPPRNQRIRTGQKVELKGFSAAGDFNRVVARSTFRVLAEEAPFPEPHNTSLQLLATGIEDCQWVQVEGTVQEAREQDGCYYLELANEGIITQVFFHNYPPPGAIRSNLLDARVRLRGVCVTFTTNRVSVARAEIRSYDWEVLEIIQPATSDAFRRPVKSVADAMLLANVPGSDSRHHLKGVLTTNRAGKGWWLKDGTNNAWLHPVMRWAPVVGDRVEVAAFIRKTNEVVHLINAECRLQNLRLSAVRQAATNRQFVPKDEDYLQLLTSAGEIRALSTDAAARGYPVKLQGVVTFHDSPEALLFVQDTSAAVFIWTKTNEPNLVPGQEVDVRGFSLAGLYSPIVADAEVTVVGTAKLPEPKQVTYESLMTGKDDAHWVELEGVARALEPSARFLSLDLMVEGRSLQVLFPGSIMQKDIDSWIDARLRIQGVMAAVVNNKRQLLGVRFLCPDARYLQVIKPAVADPFSLPLETIRSLGPRRSSAAHRVHLRGTVLHREPGVCVFISDETSCLRVWSRDQLSCKPGDVIDAAGFVAAGPTTLTLQHAILKYHAAGPPPKPELISVSDALSREFDAELVSLNATVRTCSYHNESLVMNLETESSIFEARLNHLSRKLSFDVPKPGTVARLTGICVNSTDGQGSPSFHLLLRSASDLTVLKSPPWWTLSNTIQVLGGMTVLIMVACLWLITLQRRVRTQTAMIRQRLEHETALERKLLDAQKLESLGVLAGGIAHDFNNMLTAILGNANLAVMETPASAPARPYLAEVEKTCLQAAELCRQMLAYSGRGSYEVKHYELNRLLEESRSLMQISVSKSCLLRFELSPNLPSVAIDITQVRQVVMNLVINASEAIGERNGEITVRTFRRHVTSDELSRLQHATAFAAGECVALQVTDTGCGMSPEIMARIFDPFFTTKFTGRGLGLAAVLGIMRGHHGALEVKSQANVGTSFMLLLPPVNGRASATPEIASAPVSWRGSGTILVVDDEDAVRSVTARLVKSFGFEVLTASDGVAGVEVFKAHADRIKLVLLDLTMPRLNGEAAFHAIKDLQPNVKVLLASGFSEQDASHRFSGQGLAGFLHKPFQRDELRDKLQSILDAH
jgi:signal transduction histidine kinase